MFKRKLIIHYFIFNILMWLRTLMLLYMLFTAVRTKFLSLTATLSNGNIAQPPCAFSLLFFFFFAFNNKPRIYKGQIFLRVNSFFTPQVQELFFFLIFIYINLKMEQTKGCHPHPSSFSVYFPSMSHAQLDQYLQQDCYLYLLSPNTVYSAVLMHVERKVQKKERASSVQISLSVAFVPLTNVRG